MKVNWITFCLRCIEWALAVCILGLIGRIDTKIKQARVKYIVAVGAIGTALCGIYGLPMEFFNFRYNRWILCLIDCIAWMMLLAAAIIAADDIHTCNSVGPVVGWETCRLVKAACGCAFSDFFFALVLFVFELYLIITKKDYFDDSYNPHAHANVASDISTPEKTQEP